MNPNADCFKPKAKTPPISQQDGESQEVPLSNHAFMSEYEPEEDFSPLVKIEVLTARGWVKARCFLDEGSNVTCVRVAFAISCGLRSNGSCNISFGTAGGGKHIEKGNEYTLNIRAVGGKQQYEIDASALETPCYDVKPLSDDVFTKHDHLKEGRGLVYMEGGTVDILMGRDYHPLIITERTVRAAVEPDKKPSLAYTRLGCYIFNKMNQRPKKTVNQVLAIHSLGSVEDEEYRNFFYGDVLGVKPSSRCVCSDAEIAESSFIKHVRDNTVMNEEGRVQMKVPWKPGFPENLGNNFESAKVDMMKRERKDARDGTLEAHNTQVAELLDRKFVKILTQEETEMAPVENSWYLSESDSSRLCLKS